ncbi:beta-glucosidase A [Seiridium cupressi]
MSTDRYATPLPTSLSPLTYARCSSEAYTLLPANVTYTTYSLDRSATIDDGHYGQGAYAALWTTLTFQRADLPGYKLNDSNIAAMNYFLYKQDIARLAALRVPHYPFTISWTRVVSFRVAGSPVNTQALAHYEDVINTCHEYGSTPIVTLMHADSTIGVFDDPEAFPGHFLYYSKQVMRRFADRVPIWFTICEPNMAPLFLSPYYIALTALTKADADVYHWRYKDELQGTGRISTKFANNLAVPLDSSNGSRLQASIRYQEFILDIMTNPIFLGKQIPDVVLNTPGLNKPALTGKELEYINGTADFWAFDPYVAQFAYPPKGGYEACVNDSSNPLWPSCVAS